MAGGAGTGPAGFVVSFLRRVSTFPLGSTVAGSSWKSARRGKRRKKKQKRILRETDTISRLVIPLGRRVNMSRCVQDTSRRRASTQNIHRDKEIFPSLSIRNPAAGSTLNYAPVQLVRVRTTLLRRHAKRSSSPDTCCPAHVVVAGLPPTRRSIIHNDRYRGSLVSVVAHGDAPRAALGPTLAARLNVFILRGIVARLSISGASRRAGPLSLRLPIERVVQLDEFSVLKGKRDKECGISRPSTARTQLVIASG